MLRKVKWAVLPLMAIGLIAQSLAQSLQDPEAALSGLLDDFLAGASVNDAAMHDRFWAEDLIYTSSSGTRFDKKTIMQGMTSSAEPEDKQENEGSAKYWAEEVQIRVMGDTAVVAFRLIGEMRENADADPERSEYFNTGTFVLRESEWRAVAWQATRIPAPD